MSTIKVAGEIKYEVWVTCPNLDCGYYFDLVDTRQWRESVFECAEEILEPDPDPEIENVNVDINCPECACDMVLVKTSFG